MIIGKGGNAKAQTQGLPTISPLPAGFDSGCAIIQESAFDHFTGHFDEMPTYHPSGHSRADARECGKYSDCVSVYNSL